MKLKRIQKELQALDDMVSSDISILRDRIEEASWDYSAARYVPETDLSNPRGSQSHQWGPDWDLGEDRWRWCSARCPLQDVLGISGRSCSHWLGLELGLQSRGAS